MRKKIALFYQSISAEGGSRAAIENPFKANGKTS